MSDKVPIVHREKELTFWLWRSFFIMFWPEWKAWIRIEETLQHDNEGIIRKYNIPCHQFDSSDCNFLNKLKCIGISRVIGLLLEEFFCFLVLFVQFCVSSVYLCLGPWLYHLLLRLFNVLLFLPAGWSNIILLHDHFLCFPALLLYFSPLVRTLVFGLFRISWLGKAFCSVFSFEIVWLLLNTAPLRSSSSRPNLNFLEAVTLFPFVPLLTEATPCCCALFRQLYWIWTYIL